MTFKELYNGLSKQLQFVVMSVTVLFGTVSGGAALWLAIWLIVNLPVWVVAAGTLVAFSLLVSFLKIYMGGF